MVQPPHLPPTHPDRELACEEALEDAIHAAMDGALAAGWAQGEVARAVRRLGAAWRARECENARTEEAITEALKKG